MIQEFDPLQIAQDLLRCRSVTPDEGGALDYLQQLFSHAGFQCERMLFCENGTPDVDNLYARIGTQSPHLCFAGHTDVVPPGDENLWSYAPFGGEIANGFLYGRGAADMKGGIACFTAAALNYLQKNNNEPNGSISFLITGDEEGPALNGTKKMLKTLKERRESLDHCLVGEPTNPDFLGQEIKIGRRGSLNGVLTISGKQGHVAYPDLARNPIDGLFAVMQAFQAEPLDNGTAYFSPSNLEITSIDTGNKAENVIPEQVTMMFNIRFNDKHSADSLSAQLRRAAGDALKDFELRHTFRFSSTAESFMTEPGILSDALSESIEHVTQKTPKLTTGGGTSDARFIKDHCPVLEFGLRNDTIHQIDERAPVDDIINLTRIYERFIAQYFAHINL